MTLKDLMSHIHKHLDLTLGNKQSAQVDIQINISQGGIGECYIQHKAKLVDKQIIND
jgi:hypothetical protein